MRKPLFRGVHFALLVALWSACWIVLDGHSSFAQPARFLDKTPVLKMIKLGTFRSIINLREALEASECGIVTEVNFRSGTASSVPCRLGNSASEIIGRPEFELSRVPHEIQLAFMSGKDLGFSTDTQPSLRQLYARAKTLGYSLCPAEVGPQLRLQYTNQKVGEFLTIAMQPIRDYGGELTIFSVGNGGAGLLLIGSNGNPDLTVSPSGHFLFVHSPLPPDAAVARESGLGYIIDTSPVRSRARSPQPPR